jgi:hypothetical protein
MSLINQTGFYHGVIVDAGLGQSSGGFPQEVLALKASEVYDPDSQTYLPADPEANEITAFLVLIDSKEKQTFHMPQLRKVIGWDGVDFTILREMNLADTPIAFRVGFGKGEYAERLGVEWIDTLDASPTRTVQKLDLKDAQALQARYASVLAVNKVAPKPVSAKTVSAPTPAAPTVAPAESKVRKPKAAPKPPKAAVVGKCTADEAYTACYSLKRDDVTDDALNEIWLKTIGEQDESKVTEEQWFQIKEVVLRQVSKV